MSRLIGMLLIIGLLTACQQAPESSAPAERADKGAETKAAPEIKLADAVYHSGRIYTVNPDQPWAQAVAIRDGKIVFVGSDDAVRSLIGPHTAVHDLRRRLM